jgi:hypothetical protein
MLECKWFRLLLTNTYLTSIRFVDRDMMMRFHGGGVGHKLTREATNQFLDDHEHTERNGKQMAEGIEGGGLAEEANGMDDELAWGDNPGNVVDEEVPSDDEQDDYRYTNPAQEESESESDASENREDGDDLSDHDRDNHHADDPMYDEL